MFLSVSSHCDTPDFYTLVYLIYYSQDTFPDIFLGWGKTGVDGDPMVNENYNWTGVRCHSHLICSFQKRVNKVSRPMTTCGLSVATGQRYGHSMRNISHTILKGSQATIQFQV